MYHTEVYLNQETYFAKGHIWTRAVLHQGYICYLWYVSKMEKLEDKNVEEKMNFWLMEELGGSLKKGRIFLQKELNRLAGRLGDGALHLYYKGQFISYMQNNEKGRIFLERDRGMYMSDSLDEILEEHGMEKARKELLQDTAERVANLWKERMLKAMIKGRLKGGYLLLWQENGNAV